MFRWFETVQTFQARNVRGKCFKPNWQLIQLHERSVCMCDMKIMKFWKVGGFLPLPSHCRSVAVWRHVQTSTASPDVQQCAAKILADSAILRLDSYLHLLVESRHPHNLWDHLTGLDRQYTNITPETNSTQSHKWNFTRLASLDTFSIIIQKAAIMKDLNTKWLEWQKQVCRASLVHFDAFCVMFCWHCLHCARVFVCVRLLSPNLSPFFP